MPSFRFLSLRTGRRNIRRCELCRALVSGEDLVAHAEWHLIQHVGKHEADQTASGNLSDRMVWLGYAGMIGPVVSKI